MYKSIFLIALICLSSAAAADLSEKWSKRLESADTIYQAAIKKAEDAKSIVVRKATLERVRVLKSAISEATKAGDFTAATELQSRLEAAEADGAVRPKPKNTVKFGGHEYALIEEKATWHVAKRRCEEMGGYLAIVETAQESNALLAMCNNAKSEPWIGASDEANEGQWLWIDGTPVTIDFHRDNANEIQHYLIFHSFLKNWDDGDGGARHSFICEWN